MPHYIITFEGQAPGPSDDIVYEFMDIESFIGSGNAMSLSFEFLSRMTDLVEQYEHYKLIGNVKTVKSPFNEDLSDSEIHALIGRIVLEGQEIDIGILIRETMEGAFIIGLWPDGIASFLGQDPNRINQLLQSILNRPTDWDFVYLITPV